MPPLGEVYDLVIVGSGGGSMAAALAAKRLGKKAVILEKQALVGGSTAFSGGVWWVPDNPLLAEAGIADSYGKAKLYFDSVVDYHGPGVTSARRDAFLHAAPKMVRFLRGFGMKFRRPVDDWPDYYDDLPGGLPEGRSLIPEPFDLRRLGTWADRLSLYPPSATIPLSADQFPTLFLLKRTWAGKMKAVKFALLMMRDRLAGRRTACSGAAIQGRMLQIALREGVEIQRATPVGGFLVEDGRVAGVIAEQDGRRIEVRARDGVIVNAGGFSHNKAFREQHARAPSSNEWTSANPGDTGEVIQAMMDIGAETDCLDTAWWVITSRNTNGEWPPEALRTGSVRPFMHHMDLSLPHLIMVDQEGRRFCDEAGSYMEIGERMYRRHQETGRAVPAWVIFDRRHRERYPWGSVPPGITPQQWIDSGYMKKADTIDGIAAACGIDPEGLKAEVAHFNGFCATGDDIDYKRGGRAFDRAHGDPTVKPNPNLGAIEQGPFYAVAMYPGDVGTAGGVVCDEYARVLTPEGKPIDGLYAVGNSTASVFGRSYPGAGASIAASFTFGLIAAHHSAGANGIDDILARME